MSVPKGNAPRRTFRGRRHRFWVLTTSLSLGGLLSLFQNCSGLNSEYIRNELPPSPQASPDVLAQGRSVYAQTCLVCHGPLATSPKRGRSASLIANALQSVSAMSTLSLSADQVNAVAEALRPVNNGPTSVFEARTCQDVALGGAADLTSRRLSKLEYTNTLGDLVGAEIVAGLNTLALFPNDTLRKSVTEFAPELSQEHLESIHQTSLAAAQALIKTRASLNRIAPSCVAQGLDANALTETCLQTFISSFGERVMRRPLTQARVSAYLADFNAAPLVSASTADRLEVLIARLLSAPEMVLHQAVPTGAADLDHGRIKVDAFTIASRLAYRTTDFPPDAELMSAAKAGKLATSEQVRAQAQRLLATSRGRAKVASLFHFWLALDEVYAPNVDALARLGLPTGQTTQERLRTEFVRETEEFAQDIVLDSEGSFSDLMLSPKGVPRSAEMAKILGMPSGARGPTVGTDGRLGLLTRPAILASNGDSRENVINRGLRVRLRLLCDELGPPPGDADMTAADNLATIDPSRMTSRQIAAAITGGTCMGCHSSINAPAYALGLFGPLGEMRTVERVYNPAGNLTATLPIDTSVESGIDVETDADRVGDHADLARLVAGSAKGRTCFVLNALRFTRLRNDSPADDCLIANAEGAMAKGGSLKDALLNVIANDDIFWRGYSP